MENITKIFAKNLNALMERRGENLTQLSERLGVAFSTVSDWQHGRKMPRAGSLQKIADYYNVNVTFLTSVHDDGEAANVLPISKIVRIPLLGAIACGDPILAEENIERYMSEPADYLPTGKLFYLQAKGKSMEPTIKDGSLVLIRQQPDVEDGEIAAVLFTEDNEATLKRIKRAGQTVILMPDNRDFEAIIATDDNPVRILGKAVRVTTDL